MATPAQRKLMAQVEELGFREDGTASGNAVVMRHPDAGRLLIHATPSDRRYELNKLAEARRKIRQSQDKVGQFVTWLMQKYEVPPTGIKEFSMNIRGEAKEYLKEVGPDGGKINTLSGQIGKDDRVKILERRQGQSRTRVQLIGRDVIEEPEEPTVPDAPPEYKIQPVPEAAAPLDIILEQIQRLAAQQHGDHEDLQARMDLAYTTLDQASALIGQAMDVLKEGRQRTAAGLPPPRQAQAG